MTTKEIKKKHSSRPEGGAEMHSPGRQDSWQRAQTQRQQDCGTNRAGQAAADRPHKEVAGRP